MNMAITTAHLTWEDYDASKDQHKRWGERHHPDTLKICGVPCFPESCDEVGRMGLALREVAEIEHGLMIEYLYAALTLRDRKAAATVTAIAVEEMGHLITVQNFLLALGHEPYVGLPRASNQSMPFPYQLRSFDLTVLAAFASAESPDPKQLPFTRLISFCSFTIGFPSVLLKWRLDRVNDAARHILEEPDLKIHQQNVKRVGMLYDELFQMVEKRNFIPLAENDAFLTRQALDTEEWAHAGLNSDMIVGRVNKKSDFLDLIKAIATQGEGFYHHKRSHFMRFLKLYGGMKLCARLPASLVYQADAGGGRSVRSCWRRLGVYSPDAYGPPQPNPPYPDSAALFNLRYQINLLTLLHILGFEAQDQQRRRLIAVLMQDMAFVLSVLSQFVRDYGSPQDIYRISDQAVAQLIYRNGSESKANERKNLLESLMRQSEKLGTQLKTEIQADSGGPLYLVDLLAKIGQLDAERVNNL